MRLVALAAFALLTSGCEGVLSESYSPERGKFEYSRIPGREALEAKAVAGDLDAHHDIVMWRHGSVDEYGMDDAATMQALEALVARGHSGSALTLAWFYAEGRGVEADYEKALDWRRRAAALGDEDAAQSVAQDMAAHRAWQRRQRAVPDSVRAAG